MIFRKKGFKNLLKKSGNILFSVLVVMSLLIMLASSLYLTLVSEKNEIYEGAKSEQIYQTAVSVNDWVFDYIDRYVSLLMEVDLTNNTQIDLTVTDDLVNKIVKMGIGDKIYTNSETISDNTGSYEIEIELLDLVGDRTVRGQDVTYTISIKSTVSNGTDAVGYTRVCELRLITPIDTNVTPDDNDGYFEVPQTFGGGPNSSINFGGSSPGFGGMNIRERTYFGQNSISIYSHAKIGAKTDVYGDLTMDGGATFDTTVGPLELNVYGNLTINGGFSQNYIIQSGGIIRVGKNYNSPKGVSGNTIFYCFGNFTMTNETVQSGATIYVDGDLNLGSRAIGNDVTLYVNGNLTATTNSVGSNVHVYMSNGKSRNAPNIPVSNVHFRDQGWPDTEKEGEFLKLQKAVGYEPTDEDGNVIGPFQRFYSPVWDPMNNSFTDNKDGTDISYVNRNLMRTNELFINTGDSVITLNSSGFIRSSLLCYGAESNTKAIIIDTTNGSSDPMNHKDIYIRLCKNYGSNEFVWCSGAPYINNYLSSGAYLNILVKGAGNVIFVVDNGVKYRRINQLFVGHIAWVYEWYSELKTVPADFYPDPGDPPSDPDDPNYERDLAYYNEDVRLFALNGTDYISIEPALNKMKSNLCAELRSGSTPLNAFNSNTRMQTVVNSIHPKEDCGNSSCHYCNEDNKILYNYSDVHGRYLLRQDDGSNLVDKYKNYYKTEYLQYYKADRITGLPVLMPEWERPPLNEKLCIHNSIFFVDEGNMNSEFFSMNDVIFAYVYAPDTRMTMTSIISSPNNYAINAGGYIVGDFGLSHTYIDDSVGMLHFMPAEYYRSTDDHGNPDGRTDRSVMLNLIGKPYTGFQQSIPSLTTPPILEFVTKYYN